MVNHYFKPSFAKIFFGTFSNHLKQFKVHKDGRYRNSLELRVFLGVVSLLNHILLNKYAPNNSGPPHENWPSLEEHSSSHIQP